MRSNQRNVITEEKEVVVKNYEELSMNERKGIELDGKPTETTSETFIGAEVPKPLAEANEAVSVGVCGVSETCSNSIDMSTQEKHASAGDDEKIKKVSAQLSKVSFDFTTMNCNVTSRQFGLESVLAVVNTKKNGSRVAIARSVLDEIGVKGTVQVAYSEAVDGLILGSNLNGTDYILKKSHGKEIIYNKALVQYITRVFNLDFTGITTVSFFGVEYMEHETAGKIAVIRRGVSLNG